MKMVNNCEGHVISQDTEHQPQKISFITFIVTASNEILLNTELSSTH